jgi:5S rRNA maturation endonuclease (ribonuclease M5)
LRDAISVTRRRHLVHRQVLLRRLIQQNRQKIKKLKNYVIIIQDSDFKIEALPSRFHYASRNTDTIGPDRSRIRSSLISESKLKKIQPQFNPRLGSSLDTVQSQTPIISLFYHIANRTERSKLKKKSRHNSIPNFDHLFVLSHRG